MAIQLSAEALAQLQGLPEKIKAYQDEIARAKRAGLDVSTYEARISQLEELRKGLLREYGTAPKAPPRARR